MASITMTSVDPGEGAPLQSDNYLAVYGGKGLLDMFYPVGTHYITTDDNFNPNNEWGGVWEVVSGGRVLQGADASHSVGTTIEAGLPNITGKGHFADNNGNWEGALYNVENANYIGDGSATGTRIGFDASRSNSIYGNSTTVQPPAYVVKVWHRTA